MAYITDKNGKYKRTVTCGYCYDVGHNKGSCVKMKTASEEAVAKYEKLLEEGNFVNEWERRNTERNLERHRAILHTKANRGKNRKCSHCHDVGHTKRTCPDRLEKIDSWQKNLVKQRARYVRSMQENGFGPGTLVHVLYDSKPQLALVKNVKLDEISPSHDIRSNHSWYGSPVLVDVALCRPIEYESWGQKKVITNMRAQLPLCVHNFDDYELGNTGENHRTKANGYISQIIGPLLNPEIISFSPLTPKALKRRAAALTDDYDNPDDYCNYKEG